MADSLPKTYKAAVFEKADAPLTIKELPLELPKEGELLIKVLACGVCHSDLMTQSGVMGNSFPRIPGHEAIGDVVAVGPREQNWKVGDRVGAPWHGGHDGICDDCRRGQFQMCKQEAVNGVSRDGGYAEYMTLRTEATLHVPKDVDPAEFAPLLCAGVTTFNSIRHMNISPGSIAAVQGLGGLGHLAVQFCARMGFRVVALSTSADKEDFARQLGASDYIDASKQDPVEALQKMGGASIIVATAPSAKAIEPLIDGLGSYGTLLILAPMGPMQLNTFPLILKALSVRGWASGHAQDSSDTIAFARAQKVKCMVEKFSLEDAQKALEHTASGKARFRSVLVME